MHANCTPIKCTTLSRGVKKALLVSASAEGCNGNRKGSTRAEIHILLEIELHDHMLQLRSNCGVGSWTQQVTLITTPIDISYQAAATDKSHSKLNLATQEHHLPLILLVKRRGQIAGISLLTFIHTKEKVICPVPLMVWVRMCTWPINQLQWK